MSSDFSLKYASLHYFGQLQTRQCTIQAASRGKPLFIFKMIDKLIGSTSCPNTEMIPLDRFRFESDIDRCSDCDLQLKQLSPRYSLDVHCNMIRLTPTHRTSFSRNGNLYLVVPIFSEKLLLKLVGKQS